MNRWFVALLIVLLIAGCAALSDHYKGRRALERQNYNEAIIYLNKAIITSPLNPAIFTDLGIAYFKKGDMEKASENFTRAKSTDPLYGKAYLWQGLVYENQDNIPKAISEYNEYYKQSPLSIMGFKLKARIGVLMREQIHREIQAAIQQEQSLAVDSIPENTIAVSYFANITGSEEFDVLRKGLADMIITDLSQVNSLKVLERTRMQALMDELNLGESGAIDQSTAPRAGRLLGARRMVNGALATPQTDTFRMDALATDIVVNQTDAQVYVTGNQNRFFLMEKDLVFDILDDLNIFLTQEERDAIQKLPTESFLAFLAYCRGLDYEDRGMYREAADAYKEAVKIDPNFAKANTKLKVAEAISEDPMIGNIQDTIGLEMAFADTELMASADTESGDGLSSGSRLNVMDNNTDNEFGILPEEVAEPVPSVQPPERENAIMQITVEW